MDIISALKALKNNATNLNIGDKNETYRAGFVQGVEGAIQIAEAFDRIQQKKDYYDVAKDFMREEKRSNYVSFDEF